MMPHVPLAARETLKWLAWAIGMAWAWRASELRWHIDEVPDLRRTEWAVGPGLGPRLAVIIPARNEGENLRTTLDALLLQEYPNVKVVVVDDRSTDDTGEIAEEYAARFPEFIYALRITELPDGWLGKTWALEAGTQFARAADFLLFTDADVQFSPSILWRALGYAEAVEADHLVVFPTPVLRRWTEGVTLGFFQILALWATRPWKVSDPRARHDVAGVGAFNLVRLESFEFLGGWGPQSLVVLEDITLGRRFKAAGMKQRVAFAPGMVLVHWAAGLRGLVRVMTKNLFSTVNFSVVLMLALAAWVVLFCLLPLAGLFWIGTLAPSLLMVLALVWSYRELEGMTGIPPRYGWGYPLGALALLWAMLRSMLVVLVRRGVVWRGTYYPLRDLRVHNSPLRWEREAARQRDQQRRAHPTKLRLWVDRTKGRLRRGSEGQPKK